ncbi:MAG: cytochrome c maturation protein CcmE [Chloroflexota bacterium]
MTEATWEKAVPTSASETIVHGWEKPSDMDLSRLQKTGGRWKFLVGGLLILAAAVYLIASSTQQNTRFFITVEEITTNPEYIGQTVRISGAVIGQTIQYDPEALTIEFVISHIPTDFDNLAETLHESVNNPQNARLPVYIENEVKPDLLSHEAQAILTGTLGEDGTFYATELLLKCPSRFEDGGSRNNLQEDHPGMQFNNDG